MNLVKISYNGINPDGLNAAKSAFNAVFGDQIMTSKVVITQTDFNINFKSVNKNDGIDYGALLSRVNSPGPYELTFNTNFMTLSSDQAKYLIGSNTSTDMRGELIHELNHAWAPLLTSRLHYAFDQASYNDLMSKGLVYTSADVYEEFLFRSIVVADQIRILNGSTTWSASGRQFAGVTSEDESALQLIYGLMQQAFPNTNSWASIDPTQLAQFTLQNPDTAYDKLDPSRQSPLLDYQLVQSETDLLDPTSRHRPAQDRTEGRHPFQCLLAENDAGDRGRT